MLESGQTDSEREESENEITQGDRQQDIGISGSAMKSHATERS